MTRLKLILVNIILLTLLAGCAQSGPGRANEGPATPAESPQGKKITSEGVVSAAVNPTEIPAGGSAEAVVRVTVQPGFHINANPPSYSYLRATELEIAVADQISVGFIRYPNPINKKFAFAEKPLDVYEGESSLRVLLKAAKSAPKGKQSLSGKLRIQACDDQVCYPPGSIDILVPVIIK
jgi:thioredoxin:protein disulfide reductase